MKKILYTFLFLSIAFISRGQIKVEYSIGYGNYKMEGMKTELIRIQEELKQQFPLSIAITDNFPGYVIHTAGINYKSGRHELGTNFTYLSTAGRLAYSDYSGELVDKINLNAFRIGMVYRSYFHQLALNKNNRLAFFAEVSPGLTFTKTKTKAYTKTAATEIKLDEKYGFNSTSTSLSVLPQLGLKYELPYGLGLHISGGYDIEMEGSLNQNENVKVDWSGVRIGGGFSYLLPF
ncbi:hypothetical protein [Sphingobacterium puteale]|uniref:hypothetical protein n=1 Tax=Sphingobacterium puteale TaxID=2420510 RepID=UPI003D9571C3